MDDELDPRVRSTAYVVDPTGVEAVDGVLAEVAALVERPVAEHVATFERAHDQLRRALDAAPPAADQPGA